MSTLTSVNTALTHQDASDMLVEYAANRLASFVRPYQLRRELEEMISHLRGEETRLKPVAFDELVQKATQFNNQQAGESSQKVAVKQINWLRNLISDNDVDVRAKLAANSQLTDLAGTSAKYRSEIHDTQDVASLIRKMVSEMEDLVEEEESMIR